MNIITSKDNAKIKECIELRDNKKFRKSTGKIFLEGLRLCSDAFISNVKIHSLFVTEKMFEKITDEKSPLLNADITIISDIVAQKLSDTKTSQGVFAVCEMPALKSIENLETGNGVIILSSLQDPGNVGTIIRTSEGLGIAGIIMSEDCPDIYSPKVLRGTMGGVFRLPIVISENIKESIAFLKNRNVNVYATALDDESISIKNFNLKGSAVVIGNEGNGISEDIKSICDNSIIIPISETSESLNAAVAASILAWEMVR